MRFKPRFTLFSLLSTLATVQVVKGGELRPGDRVLVECVVKKIDNYDHPIAVPVEGNHWHLSPHGRTCGYPHLWTWGGEYGAGIDSPAKINLLRGPGTGRR